jgi:hypothetical protein
LAKQKTPFSTTTFRFAAYRDFKRTLGKINAVIEGAELATRKFVHEVQQSPDRNVFVQEVSKTYGVRIDALDIALLRQQMSQFYIISVHQQFEAFLKDFQKELPDVQWKRGEGDSLLKGVLGSLPGGYNEVVGLVGRLEVDLADYYRLVRNNFAHADTDATIRKRIDELRSEVEKDNGKYSRLRAPNTYASIDFDDFILFSRIAKTIALGLCGVARPSDVGIAAMLKRLNKRKYPGVDFGSLVERTPDPERLKRALTTLLRSVYSVDEQEGAPIVRILMSGPLA